MKILIMERAGEIAETIAENLRELGYQFDFVESFDQVIGCLLAEHYDCVVADMSVFSGLTAEMIKSLRAVNKHMGLIVTSTDMSFQERVDALHTGADDFLAKPFDPSELTARILALCRRTAVYNRDVLVYREIKIDMSAKTVSANDRPLHLTKKELELLLYFLDHKNSVIRKDNLITFLSGQLLDFKSNADIIYAHVKNLKKKMSEAGCNMYLKTVYGIGYKWDDQI